MNTSSGRNTRVQGWRCSVIRTEATAMRTVKAFEMSEERKMVTRQNFGWKDGFGEQGGVVHEAAGRAHHGFRNSSHGR